MSRKKLFTYFLLFIPVAILVVGIYGYREYNRKSKDTHTLTVQFSVSAEELIHAFQTSETVSNKKYPGKVLLVSGKLKTIHTDSSGLVTLVLGDTASLSSVRCSMAVTSDIKASQFLPGSEIMVKGICTGFNPDDMGLGADVLLNNCIISKTNQ
jgi:hypothetical protein